MFVGHAALALAAKRRAPTISLGWLLAAAITPDLIRPVLQLAGAAWMAPPPGMAGFPQVTMRFYPWSHSLVAAIGWGVLVLLVARWRGVSPGASLLLGALVVSHWFLDLFTHTGGLPLGLGDAPRVGMGAWAATPATAAFEGGLFLLGIWIYLRATAANDRAGSIGLWSFLLVLTALWATTPWDRMSLGAGTLDGFRLIGEWMFVGWAAWADQHRHLTPVAA